MLSSTDLLTIEQALKDQIIAVKEIKRDTSSEFLKKSCDNNIERYKDTLEKVTRIRKESMK